MASLQTEKPENGVPEKVSSLQTVCSFARSEDLAKQKVDKDFSTCVRVPGLMLYILEKRFRTLRHEAHEWRPTLFPRYFVLGQESDGGDSASRDVEWQSQLSLYGQLAPGNLGVSIVFSDIIPQLFSRPCILFNSSEWEKGLDGRTDGPMNEHYL